MDWACTAFGLRIRTTAEIPGLAADDPSHASDLCISLNGIPDTAREARRECWYQSVSLNDDGRPNLIIWRLLATGAFHFVYDDGIEFLVASDGRHIWCEWSAAATLTDAAVYLRGPILGMVLRLKGHVGLHAGSVAIGQCAVAISGPAGAGKSTMTAALVAHGYPLLADDVSALEVRESAVFVLPGPTRVSLWPDAGRMLYGAATSLPRVTPADGLNPSWDKRYVDALELGRFQSTPLPLAAIYVLGPREVQTEEPRIEALGPHEAFVELTEDTYVNYAMDDRMRAREFDVLGRIVRTIPVRKILRPADPASVPDVCRLLLEDFAR
jgi:hypothetical protein